MELEDVGVGGCWSRMEVGKGIGGRRRKMDEKED